MSTAITFAPPAFRRSITWPCRRRGYGHCRFRSLRVLPSTPTTTRSRGGFSAPRTLKRESTVLSSTDLNRSVAYATTPSATATTATTTSSSARSRCRRPTSAHRRVHDQSSEEQGDQVEALVDRGEDLARARGVAALDLADVAREQAPVVLDHVRHEDAYPEQHEPDRVKAVVGQPDAGRQEAERVNGDVREQRHPGVSVTSQPAALVG